MLFIVQVHFLLMYACMYILQVYPYLVVNDTQVSRCRSEERVLQLLAMLNLCLDKNKVSSVLGFKYINLMCMHACMYIRTSTPL